MKETPVVTPVETEAGVVQQVHANKRDKWTGKVNAADSVNPRGQVEVWEGECGLIDGNVAGSSRTGEAHRLMVDGAKAERCGHALKVQHGVRCTCIDQRHTFDFTWPMVRFWRGSEYHTHDRTPVILGVEWVPCGTTFRGHETAIVHRPRASAAEPPRQRPP